MGVGTLSNATVPSYSCFSLWKKKLKMGQRKDLMENNIFNLDCNILATEASLSMFILRKDIKV
jgi:hypothetical protein